MVSTKPQQPIGHRGAHHGRSSQYATSSYRAMFATHGFTASMSRRANCWDHAVVESFFHTLKTELVHHRRYTTRDDAKQNIFKWIEVFYYRVRQHSTLGYRSPAKFEAMGETVLTRCP